MRIERTTRGRIRGNKARNAWLLFVAGGVALAGCDLGVTNPALIEEGDLDTPNAVPAIVNGAMGSFGIGTTINGGGGVYSVSATLAGELVHSGSWVPLREISAGTPNNESPENQSHWGNTSQARWQAENAVTTVQGLVADPGSNAWVARAQLYAGFANRLMGETFCDAVIDGGARQDHTAFSSRAVSYFSDAAQTAQAGGHNDLRLAALAGEAQALLMLGEYSQAASLASSVPTSFVFAHVHSENSTSEHNGVHNWAFRGDNGFQYTVWGTEFAEYGLDSFAPEAGGDPRVTFRSVNASGGAQVGGDNRRPVWRAEKYPARNSSIPLAKGTEMRLIEAEALLRQGNVSGAVAQINQVRSHHELEPVSASSTSEAWTLLVRERGIELWLEGRRLGDLRRWGADATTAPFAQVEVVGAVATGQPATADPTRNVQEATPFCLRVSTNEIFSNPNLANDPPR